MKFKFLLCIAVIFLGVACVAAQSLPSVTLPGFTAYAEPNPEAMEISESGPITGWSDAQVKLAWYGQLRATGTLDVALRLRLPVGETSTLLLTVGEGTPLMRTVTGTADFTTVSFGAVTITEAAAIRIALTGVKKSGKEFAVVDALELSGPAAKRALFNLTPQRGAPSVHLNYPVPQGAEVEWFYNEVTAKKDPIWSYYEVCGFSRGYFGMQVNSPTERRIIFSVWDSGDESTDRDKVAAENRVQLVAKGTDVVASDFGNEGTGGHSHLVYPWKTGETYRFLVSAKPDGNGTIYTGWFYFPEHQAWGLIASFRAPKDGKYLRGFYSFNEDFDGANGQQQRLAEFGNQWIKTTDGKWTELTKATFTHTARGPYKDRKDRAAGTVGDHFYLTNGGFTDETMEFNEQVTRPASGVQPVIQLPVVSTASTTK